MYSLLLPLIVIVLIGLSALRRSQFISEEKAFETVRTFLKSNPLVQNGQKTFDLSFLKDVTNGNDAAEDRFQANPPTLVEGKGEQESLYLVGFEEVYGSRNAISTGSSFWRFSWNRPGVLDESYTFYVNATSGALSLIGHFQSPD